MIMPMIISSCTEERAMPYACNG
eukprot:SAG11_NODE_30595_length_299_cov_1.280000_1_plen_22_part_01